MRRTIVVILLGLIFCINACESESPDSKIYTLNEGEVFDGLHQNNLGKITFMGDFIPFSDYSEADFLAEFDFKDGVNLHIRSFLKKTLAYSLAQLNPELSVNELCKNGNFQFSFYVDGKLIYTENLNAGAGTIESKNSMTVFSQPLLSVEGADSWGRFLWARFMNKGGRKALRAGSHKLKIEIRPYLEMDELKVGELIAEGELILNIVRKNITESEMAIQDIQDQSGWNISSYKYNNEKIISLNKNILNSNFKKITSIVVIKNRKLLLEEYFNGAERSSLHDTRSVGKTVASTMMGIAIEDGHIKDENQTLNDFYKLKDYQNHSPEKAKVSLKDLLSMRSGFEGFDFDMDSPGNEENMYPTADWVKFTLDLPMDKRKTRGKDWQYFTAGVVVLGDILHQNVPGGLEKYTHSKLFTPLGITDYKWQYTPQKVVNTAGGLQMRSLDYAKFGQLYKDGGLWNGEQLIPADWVKKSLAQHVKLPEEGGKGFYGFLFWNKTYIVNGAAQEVAYCSGNGGNKIFIFKDLPIVIVITATAYNKAYGHGQVDDIMENYILPAVVE